MRILSFSYFLPYQGVPHAGGEYYLRHVEALLRQGHEVTLVAPATPANVAATSPAGAAVLLVPELRTAWTRAADAIAAQLRHAVLPPRFTTAVLRDGAVFAAVKRADLLEFQWVPSAALRGPLLRRTGAAPASACVAHDVVVQSLRRQAGQPGLGPARRTLRHLRALVGRVEERRALRGMDLVLTFSEKDRALLRAYGVEAQVVDPPLAGPDFEPRAEHEADGSRLLFVGAFDRIENSDAADWLLEEIWPRIRADRPEVRLELVGAHPTAAMRRAAAAADGVSVSGYVEDLGPHYASADLAVVPLRLGAGVKFKVVTAMLSGVPVVTTSVGAEGISDRPEDVFVAVEDEADAFVGAVLGHLRDRAPGTARAAAARAAAADRYGSDEFERRLDAAYRAVVASGTRRAGRAARPLRLQDQEHR